MKTFKYIFSATVAIVAVVTLLFSVYTNYTLKQNEEIRTWQKIVVLNYVGSKDSPVTFKDIRNNYVTESQAYEDHNLPKSELSIASTRRILLELVRDGALVQKEKDSFSISIHSGDNNRAVDNYRDEILSLLSEQKEIQEEIVKILNGQTEILALKKDSTTILNETLSILREQHKMTKIIDDLSSILTSNPGKFTRKGLATALAEKSKIQISVANHIVSKAIASKTIFIDFRKGQNQVTYFMSDAPNFFFGAPKRKN